MTLFHVNDHILSSLPPTLQFSPRQPFHGLLCYKASSEALIKEVQQPPEKVAQKLLQLRSSSMNPRILFVVIAILFTKSFSLEADPKPASNITVVGTVFCDACFNNNFSKHSYSLQGAKVLLECSFRVNSMSTEEISIKVDRITDKFGVYRVDIPPVDGFDCKEGREIQSFCRATLISSSSSLCKVPGLASSTEHWAIKLAKPNLCVYNLNALNYRPSTRDATLCGAKNESLSSDLNLNSSFFFWPPCLPWPHFPWPFPSPPSLPFPLPPWFPSPSPPSFPFPLPPLFPSPPPSFPFPLPPLFPTPSPPPLPFPFPPLPPSIFPAPPPPPPFFPIPLPPLPPLTPLPPLFASPPPPPPPPPSFPFPFPPLPPLIPSPNLPSPPPPSPSPWDPRTWFPSHPPPSPNQPPQDYHP